MLHWLFHYSVDDKHKQLKKKRARGSLTWLFQEEKFKKWISGHPGDIVEEASMLYCHGSGKSLLVRHQH